MLRKVTLIAPDGEKVTTTMEGEAVAIPWLGAAKMTGTWQVVETGRVFEWPEVHPLPTRALLPEAERICTLCGDPATHRLDGFVDDGLDEGYAYILVCEQHKREFDEWDEVNRLHGFVYIEETSRLDTGEIL